MPPRWTRVIGPMVLLACAAETRAQELRGRVRETFQSLSTGDARAEIFLQNYEINFRNDITQSLFWQARLRALVTGLDGTDAASSSDSILNEPFFQMVYEGSEWQASGGARLTSLSPRGDLSTAAERERQDLFGHLAWSREGLPRLDWSVYRIDLESDQQEASREDRSLLTTSWTRGAGGLNLGLEKRSFTDLRTDFTRDAIQITGNGDLRGSLLDGRITLGGQALLVEGRVEEEAPRALSVDALRRPRAGLFAEDTTPLVGALASAPALIDGDVTAPAVDLSGDFRNIGVDLGFAETLDTAFVYLERRLLPASEADYRWDVHTSTDGEFWTLLAAGASSRFDGLLNRFEIRFPSVTTRWLKVVNTSFSRDEPPLAATEIQVSGLETRSGRERTTQSLQSGNVTAAWRATRMLDVSFNAFANRQAAGGDDGGRSDGDFSSTLAATIRPGKTSTTVRLQAINRRVSLGRPEADRIASITFAAAPLEDLDLSVTGTHRRNASPREVLVEADALEFRGAARISRGTEAALDLGLLRQDEESLERITTRRNARLSLVTTLRPGLFVSNGWSVERIRFSGSAAGLSPGRTDLDLRSRLSYRPTRVLGAAVELLYQDIAGFSGLSRLYDLDWLPFPGGALQVQMSFRQDRRSVLGDLREETRLGARWTMNPRTLLDVAYTLIKSGTISSERQEVASAFLEYRF